MKKIILSCVLFASVFIGTHANAEIVKEIAPETPVEGPVMQTSPNERALSEAKSGAERRQIAQDNYNLTVPFSERIYSNTSNEPKAIPERDMNDSKEFNYLPKLEDRGVIGNDDRAKANVFSSPFKQIAKIEMQFPNGQWYRGSGTLIGGAKVLTAGHVLYDRSLGGWANTIIVMPGLNNGNPQGNAISTARQSYAPIGYVDNNDSNYDMGIILLETNLGYMGTVGYGINGEGTIPSGMISGYPGDKEGGLSQWYGVGNAIVGSQIISYQIDTSGGQSGGPIINNGNGQVIGVHTGGSSVGNSGVRITNNLKNEFIDAIN